MRRTLCICISALLIMTVAACSTSNVGVLTAPQDDDRQGFAVSTEPGSGSFTPELVVEETASGVTVSVRATGAEDLSAAFVHVSYDNTLYTPVAVDMADYLGSAVDTLSLAVTSVPGDVAVGMTQVAGAINPRSGNGLLATIRFEDGEFIPSKVTAGAPVGGKNTVNDLDLNRLSGNTIQLNWSERNVGDYDNNGEVGISDLSPLGQLFGQSLGSMTNPGWGELVDGDENGELNIADMSPIGGSFGTTLAGYHIYTDVDGLNALQFVDRADFYVDNKNRVIYSVDVSVEGMVSPTFTVRGAVSETDTSEIVGPKSNPQPLIIETGPPAAPTALSAISGEAIGNASIKTDWTASTSGDVIQYEIARKLNSESEWTTIGTTTSSMTSYVDDTATEDALYDYQVRAKDIENLFSFYTDVASETPWLQPGPDAPMNLTAAPGSGSLAIALDWDIPSGVIPTTQTLYRSDGDPDNYVEIANPAWNVSDASDSGLTAGVTYYYYVTLTVAGLESDPSNQAFSLCSEEATEVINITGLTTDKTTFHAGGADGVAGAIVVTTDESPTNVEWSDSIQGVIAGETGSTLNWTPPGGAAEGLVTVTCKVFNGAATDTDTIELILTSMTIQTSYNNNGIWDVCAGDGYFIDFSASMTEHMNEPYKSMSDFIDGDHVVTFNCWDMWCPPCRNEMPEMHDWAVEYKADGYYHVGLSSTYSVQRISDWQDGSDIGSFTPGGPYPEFHFFNDPKEGTGGQWTGTPIYQMYWEGYGGAEGKSLPRSMLFDKDGFCRRVDTGMVDSNWADSIESLLGLL